MLTGWAVVILNFSFMGRLVLEKKILKWKILLGKMEIGTFLKSPSRSLITSNLLFSPLQEVFSRVIVTGKCRWDPQKPSLLLFHFTNASRKKCHNHIDSAMIDWNWIWKCETILRIKLFMWICHHDCIPSASMLHKRGINISLICTNCNISEENTLQIFRVARLLEKSGLI